MTYISDVVAAVESFRLAMERSRKTVICHPGSKDLVAGLVDQAGLNHLVSVQASPLLPEGQAYVFSNRLLHEG